MQRFLRILSRHSPSETASPFRLRYHLLECLTDCSSRCWASAPTFQKCFVALSCSSSLPQLLRALVHRRKLNQFYQTACTLTHLVLNPGPSLQTDSDGVNTACAADIARFLTSSSATPSGFDRNACTTNVGDCLLTDVR